jgi:hypothetical protein
VALSFEESKVKMIVRVLQLLRILPNNNRCSNKLQWQNVNDYSHAFSNGLGQTTILDGDPVFADTFKPLFHSVSHDMGLEGLSIPLNGSLNQNEGYQFYDYHGILKRLRFEAKTMRLTEFKTSNNDPKNVHFSGFFKDIVVCLNFYLVCSNYYLFRLPHMLHLNFIIQLIKMIHIMTEIM